MSDQEQHEQGEPSLEGTLADLSSSAQLARAVEEAFDYRGDVTVTVADGRTIEGYVFDREEAGGAVGQSSIRIMPSDGSDRVTILCSQIEKLVFTGRDTAAGKSWETWVKQQEQQQAEGECAGGDGGA